ncbi:hypothetical protein LSM04_004393 [Trypanosoma melophagium]|uniref:uncharacterized protein n=1 Tax=Trypanosoma melophagium TaxID=715481 RepID=UPI00351A164A|nr:hypothetical protein LSM04_004393 [Trypanosoma melophagium]
MRFGITLTLVAVLILMLLCNTSVSHAEVDCGYCRERGYSYICRAPLSQASTCFSNSGEVQCNGNMCTCCRKTAATGCTVCDDDDFGSEEFLEDF